MRALFFLHFLFSLFLHNISDARDTITSTQFLKDGDTIISSDGNFEMGFFSIPAGSINLYVGIWYKQLPVQTVVWIANRETALTNTTSAVLKIVEPGGQLALIDGKNEVIWSANASRSAQNPIAQLLDSGNLVVRDNREDENFLWQSFDYPTDTYLPGMKLGWNFLTQHEVYITSWKNENDPASGPFTHHFDPTGYPQLVTKNGLKELFIAGPWNGLRWSGTPEMDAYSPHYKYHVSISPREVYTRYDLINNPVLTRVVMTSSGELQVYIWVNETQSWVSALKVPRNSCDSYAICGANGVCNITASPVCGCFEKFTSRKTRVGLDYWSDGCHRRKPLKCKNGTDGFKKYSGIKWPDTKHSWFNTTMNLTECEHKCLKNCSCTAYSNLDIRNGGTGCLLWFNDLIDIRVLYQNGQDIYIRLDSSEIPAEPIRVESHASSKGKKVKIVLGCLLLLIVMIVLGLCLGLNIFKKSKKKMMKLKEWLELPLFDLSTISRATNNFSENNKLGEGGFGIVYKGVLDDKQEVAVKRLSKTSTQGLLEFKNEVICIAKLQHRNLVKLLGCCIQGEEKLLVYEYLANKSLDTFIFDEAKSKLIDWPKRFSIINGIARGLMYLHQDSRLRVIHRDLKASNVLLDDNMNPKISDFGLARSVGGDATEANASRIMGTHGYISPEYAAKGVFSIKSDTFSFGVLSLEIVSGQRNRGFFHPDHSLNLIGHAWKLYKENRAWELIDVHLASSCDLSQVKRCIHVGLLCAQQCPEDRPTMFSVVTMLSNDNTLPEAKEPGFFIEQSVNKGNYSSSTQKTSSRNECTITDLHPR